MNNAEINWKDEYKFNDKYIDSEHQKLFEIAKKANDVHLLPTDEEKREFLRKVTKDLKAYANSHFKHEEKYMKQNKFPFTSEHISAHNELLDILNFISVNIDILSVEQIEFDIYNFIQNIFVKHMTEVDTKIIKFKEELQAK